MAKRGVELPSAEETTVRVNYGDREVEAHTSPALELATRDIASQMGANIDKAGNIRTDPGKAPGRKRDPQFENRIASMRQRFRATGIQPASVINFLPIHLTVNSPSAASRNGVKPARGAARYSFHTWTDPDIQIVDLGEQGKDPRDFHPMQIAEAFQFEYPDGGVVAIPVAEKDFGKFEDVLKRTEEAAIRWMHSQVDLGDQKAQKNVFINNTEKLCAQRLFDLKIIQALPKWVVEKRQLQDLPSDCPRCGKTPGNRHAVQCACGYILDPKRAFENHVISEEDESLERLTRAQVTEMGISDYVAETIDERPERLKAGIPKALSAAAERAIEAEESLSKR